MNILQKVKSRCGLVTLLLWASLAPATASDTVLKGNVLGSIMGSATFYGSRADMLSSIKREQLANTYTVNSGSMVRVLEVVTPATWNKEIWSYIKSQKEANDPEFTVEQVAKNNFNYSIVEIETTGDHKKLWVVGEAIFAPCIGGPIQAVGVRPAVANCHTPIKGGFRKTNKGPWIQDPSHHY